MAMTRDYRLPVYYGVMAKRKRGYTHTFPTNLAQRIKREIDWVPPALDQRLRAKCQREGISLRALTLTLWWRWVRGDIETATTDSGETQGT